VFGLSTGLKELSFATNNLVLATKGTQQELHLLRDELDRAAVDSHSMQEVFSRSQATSAIKIREGDEGTVVLEWLDEEFEPEMCLIAVTAKHPNSSPTTIEVQVKASQCVTAASQESPQSWNGTYEVTKNELIDLGPKWHVPFHLVVDEVAKPLWKKAMFEIRFEPDIHLRRILTSSSPAINK
jgi:hypothetical protein